MLLHCFALVSLASARRDKAPGFGHFSATAHYRHSLPPPIPPWYSGASHEYQHGHACPTTEPHPTTLVKHTHTQAPALIASITLPALLSNACIRCRVGAGRGHALLPQRTFLCLHTNSIILVPSNLIKVAWIQSPITLFTILHKPQTEAHTHLLRGGGGRVCVCVCPA